jgi:hypothetical protein
LAQETIWKATNEPDADQVLTAGKLKRVLALYPDDTIINISTPQSNYDVDALLEDPHETGIIVFSLWSDGADAEE